MRAVFGVTWELATRVTIYTKCSPSSLSMQGNVSRLVIYVIYAVAHHNTNEQNISQQKHLFCANCYNKVFQKCHI